MDESIISIKTLEIKPTYVKTIAKIPAVTPKPNILIKIIAKINSGRLLKNTKLVLNRNLKIELLLLILPINNNDLDILWQPIIEIGIAKIKDKKRLIVATLTVIIILLPISTKRSQLNSIGKNDLMKNNRFSKFSIDKFKLDLDITENKEEIIIEKNIMNKKNL